MFCVLKYSSVCVTCGTSSVMSALDLHPPFLFLWAGNYHLDYQHHVHRGGRIASCQCGWHGGLHHGRHAAHVDEGAASKK